MNGLLTQIISNVLIAELHVCVPQDMEGIVCLQDAYSQVRKSLTVYGLTFETAVDYRILS